MVILYLNQGDAALPGDGEDPDCPIPEAWRRIGFEWLIDDPSVYIKPGTIAYVLQIMNFGVKMMNSGLKVMTFVLKMD